MRKGGAKKGEFNEKIFIKSWTTPFLFSNNKKLNCSKHECRSSSFSLFGIPSGGAFHHFPPLEDKSEWRKWYADVVSRNKLPFIPQHPFLPIYIVWVLPTNQVVSWYSILSFPWEFLRRWHLWFSINYLKYMQRWITMNVILIQQSS